MLRQVRDRSSEHPMTVPRHIPMHTELPRLNMYYSSAVSGKMSDLLGAPHYSYRFAEEKFLGVMQSLYPECQQVEMPEYYGGPASLMSTAWDRTAPSVHLIFRSTEQIRLLKSALNICCFAWEFDVLKTETLPGEHPFLNQARMLSLCDEVWVPSLNTLHTLYRNGIKHAFYVPAPITIQTHVAKSIYDLLAEIGNVNVCKLYSNFLLSRTANRDKCAQLSSTLVQTIARMLRDHGSLKVYLAILNPEDFRKNLDVMLKAFHYFSLNHPDAVLLVKALTSSSRFDILDVVSDVVTCKLGSGTSILSHNILFFNDYLSDEQMKSLYRMADFYLCTSIAEGQNLPLLEAMSHGVVPVTTGHTAMLDYIDKNNAIVIQDTLVTNEIPNLAGTIAQKPFSVNVSSVEQVHNALVTSATLSPHTYEMMAESARHVVVSRYSSDVVAAKVIERLIDLYAAAEDRRASWLNER